MAEEQRDKPLYSDADRPDCARRLSSSAITRRPPSGYCDSRINGRRIRRRRRRRIVALVIGIFRWDQRAVCSTSASEGARPTEPPTDRPTSRPGKTNERRPAIVRPEKPDARSRAQQIVALRKCESGAQMQLSGLLMQQQLSRFSRISLLSRMEGVHRYKVPPSSQPLASLHFNSFRQSHSLIQRLPMFLPLYTLR